MRPACAKPVQAADAATTRERRRVSTIHNSSGWRDRAAADHHGRAHAATRKPNADQSLCHQSRPKRGEVARFTHAARPIAMVTWEVPIASRRKHAFRWAERCGSTLIRPHAARCVRASRPEGRGWSSGRRQAGDADSRLAGGPITPRCATIIRCSERMIVLGRVSGGPLRAVRSQLHDHDLG